MPNIPPPPVLRAEVASVAPPPAAMMRGRSSFVSVQLGAFASRSYAEEGLKSFRGRLERTPQPPLRIAEAVVRGRSWFRVLAGPFSTEAAEALCRSLSTPRSACLVRVEPNL